MEHEARPPARFSSLRGIQKSPEQKTKEKPFTQITLQNRHRLTSVVIPNSVTSIGPSTFNWCPLLTSLTLPSSVTSVGYNAFYDCYGLTNVSFGNSFTNIGVEAFFACSGLTSLALPNSLTSISAWAFGSCQGLTKVSIPNSVTSIGDYAFDYCRALTNVFFQGNAPASFARSAFAETVNAFTVYYPATATGFSTPTWNGYPAFPYSPIQPPQAQTKIGGFGVSANGFGFNITAPSNTVVVVQASTNLANSNWYPLATNAITSGSAYFSDPQGINQPCRFYRLLLP